MTRPRKQIQAESGNRTPGLLRPSLPVPTQDRYSVEEEIRTRQQPTKPTQPHSLPVQSIFTVFQCQQRKRQTQDTIPQNQHSHTHCQCILLLQSFSANRGRDKHKTPSNRTNTATLTANVVYYYSLSAPTEEEINTRHHPTEPTQPHSLPV